MSLPQSSVSLSHTHTHTHTNTYWLFVCKSETHTPLACLDFIKVEELLAYGDV